MSFDVLKWEKWKRWAEIIRKDVSGTVNDHARFTAFRENVLSDPDWLDAIHGGLFCDLVARSFVARAALGIRRQVKSGERSDEITLVRLIREIRENAELVTFDFYMVRFPDEGIPWQEGSFRTLSEDGRHLSRQVVEADEVELFRLCTEIETFADKAVAHADKNGYKGSFTWGDLGAAVNALNALVCKYYCLLTGIHSNLEAVIQFDWMRAFRHPLKRPESAMVLPAHRAGPDPD